MRMINTLLVFVMIALLSACSTNKGAKGAGNHFLGADDNMRFYGSDLSPEQERALVNRRVYYFDYDRYELKEEDVQGVYAHAKRLMNSERKRVRVEGHTDERGSREYNIALGERRARAVADILMAKGVPQSQISIVSYGKEKPAVQGHDEAAWAENRRVVLVYEVE